MMNLSIDNSAVSQQAGELVDIVKLKVKFDAEHVRNKVLFGNGRMQVKVQVLISGCDADGNYVNVPRNVLDTIELIHYNSGERLRNGWSASTEQGQYTQEAPTYSQVQQTSEEDRNLDVHTSVCTFWVSSAGVGTTQIAARVTVNGNVIKSNGTSLISSQDSSVTLDAQLPIKYSLEMFHLKNVRRGNEASGNRIWNYYLGLDYQGQQIRLVDWISSEHTGDVTIASGNWLGASDANWLQGIFVRPNKNHVTVWLPVNDNTFINYIFRDESLDSSGITKEYVVRVNDRYGELTIVQALSEEAHTSAQYKTDTVFNFSVIDQYGTEHKLAIRTDFDECSFTLERG